MTGSPVASCQFLSRKSQVGGVSPLLAEYRRRPGWLLFDSYVIRNTQYVFSLATCDFFLKDRHYHSDQGQEPNEDEESDDQSLWDVLGAVFLQDRVQD